MSALDRVLAFLAPRTVEEGDCLLWTKAVNSSAHPVASIDGQRSIPVRRWVFVQLNGAVPASKRVVARCGHPRCVAPGCTIAVTPSGVNQRIAARGGFSTAQRLIAVRRAARLACSPLVEADIPKIIERRFVHEEKLESIAADYPVGISTISRICRGESWSGVVNRHFEGLLR